MFIFGTARKVTSTTSMTVDFRGNEFSSLNDHDDTHVYCDSCPLCNEITAKEMPPPLDDGFIYPHSLKLIIVRLLRSKKHCIEDQREAGQWIRGIGTLLEHRCVSVGTSVRLTMKVEELGMTFRMYELYAELPEMKNILKLLINLAIKYNNETSG